MLYPLPAHLPTEPETSQQLTPLTNANPFTSNPHTQKGLCEVVTAMDTGGVRPHTPRYNYMNEGRKEGSFAPKSFLLIYSELKAALLIKVIKTETIWIKETFFAYIICIFNNPAQNYKNRSGATWLASRCDGGHFGQTFPIYFPAEIIALTACLCRLCRE